MSRLVAAIALLCLVAVPARAQQASSHAEINQAWMFLENGNARKAEEIVKQAYMQPWGPVNAELHFLLSAIFWERRNAMAAHQWLADAQKNRAERGYEWEPGDGWDQRIDKRKEFLDRNFGIVKLRWNARPVPPLHDPPSKDPVVKAFADAIPGRVSEAQKAGSSTLYLVIPRGTYWVGDRQVEVKPGILELSQAPTWDLAASPRARSVYAKRASEIAAGRSPANAAKNAEVTARQEAARQAAAAASRGEGEAARTPPPAASGAGRGTSEANATKPPAVAEPAGGPLGSGVRVALGGGGTVGTLLDRWAEGAGAAGGGRFVLEAGFDGEFSSPVGIRIAARGELSTAPVCDAHAATAGLGGLVVGPRFAIPVASSAWFTAVPALRVDGGAAFLGSAAKRACAAGTEGGGGLRVRVSDGDAVGAVEPSELGWRGAMLGVGPLLDVGLMVAPAEGAPKVGIGVQFGYHHTMPILPAPRDVYFRTESGAIETAEVGVVGSAASWGRFTLSVHAAIQLP